MRKTLAIAAAAVAITAGGATAFAAVSHSGTDDTPRTSQQSVPNSVAPTASIERHGGLDDGPNHDLGDDRGGDRGALNGQRGGLDDGPNHDLGDDRSVTTVPSQPSTTRPTAGPSTTYYQRGGLDDGPNHDLGDDHGGDRGDRHGGHDGGDDHGGRH